MAPNDTQWHSTAPNGIQWHPAFCRGWEAGRQAVTHPAGHATTKGLKLTLTIILSQQQAATQPKLTGRSGASWGI